MPLNYGNSSIPSDVYTVLEGGTVSIASAFDRSITLVGGMDTNNGSATEGNLVEVTDPADAISKFGDGSELHEAADLAFSNGANTVHALPVSETQTTESSLGTSGTLSNPPIFDPNIHDEHSITAADTGGTDPTVQITYDDPSNLSLSTDEVAVNPITGKYEFDAAASGSYELTYTYGDYGSSVLQTAADQGDRIVAVGTENTSVISDLATELKNNASDLAHFQHGVAGATPRIDGNNAATYASNYTDSIDEERITLVSPPRGYIDDAETDQHRTAFGVAGYFASLPLGISSTNDDISGYTGLRTELSPSDAANLTDDQVTPLIDYPPVTIVKDMTTSTTTKFERVYAMQVVDEVTELSHEINRNFVGDQNTQTGQNQLERSHLNMLRGLEAENPPLIVDHAVNAVQNSSNDNQVDVNLGIKVVPTMDTIDVTITVGDIVRGVQVT